jgi:hypothetical protein
MPISRDKIIGWLDERGLPHDPRKLTQTQNLEMRAALKICGATNAKEEPCGQPPGKLTGRCKYHGERVARGINHYNYQGKGRSKYLPLSIQEIYNQLRSDDELLSLEHDVAMVDVRQSLLMMSLTEGGNPAEKWKQLESRWNYMWQAVARGDNDAVTKHREEIARIISDGDHEYVTWAEYISNAEARRKLVETETKIQERKGLVLGANRVMAVAQALLMAIDEEVNDQQVRSSIGERFIRIIRAADLPELASTGDDIRESS